MKTILNFLTETKLTVFHGTDSDVSKFDRKFLGTSNGETPSNMMGFYFTDNIEVARSFGKNILTCEITIDRPLVVDAGGLNYSQFKHKLNSIVDKINTKKYDSIIVENYLDAGKYSRDYLPSTQYIVFDVRNIKITKTELVERINHK